MKNVFKIISLIVIVVIAFSGCKKSDIEKANEDYNFDDIEPVIYAITGPTATAASGLVAVMYDATPRGGSTYAWNVEGHGATITVLDPSFQVEVLWDQSDVDVEAKVVCVETTLGDKTSPPAELNVSLSKFCPMTFDQFVGTWTGTEAGDCENDPFTVTFIAGTEANSLVAEATDGTPAFLGCVFEDWGETFQPGFGNEGDIILHVGLLDGSITINLDYWGQTLPGPWDYWTVGDGTWSGCGDAPSMVINFGLDWDETGTAQYASTITLSKD